MRPAPPRVDVSPRWLPCVQLAAAVIGLGACQGSGSECEAGFGLAADGKCYPIYDPFDPPWSRLSTDSGSTDGGSGSGGSGAGAGGGTAGAEGGGAAGEGASGAGGGETSPPTVEGAYGVARDAPITSGEGFYIGVWTMDIGDLIPASPTVGEATLDLVAPGDTVGFRVELTAVPPDGTEVWVAGVLVQGDGDITDDPHVIWSGNPGIVTPTAPLLDVELVIE